MGSPLIEACVRNHGVSILDTLDVKLNNLAGFILAMSLVPSQTAVEVLLSSIDTVIAAMAQPRRCSFRSLAHMIY